MRHRREDRLREERKAEEVVAGKKEREGEGQIDQSISNEHGLQIERNTRTSGFIW